jgi:hypothetical protein
MTNDPNWPNGGTQTGDETLVRPVIVRAWQGRILVAYQSSTLAGNKSGPLYVRAYDPYPGSANGWTSGATVLENITTMSSPALAYDGLYAYVFYWDAGSGFFSYCPMFLPPLDSSHNVQYGQGFTGTPQQLKNLGLVNLAGAAVFNGSIYLVWLGQYVSSEGGSTLYYSSASLDTAPNLSFGDPVILNTPSVPVTNNEVSLTAFNGLLYCLYTTVSGNLRVLTIDADGTIGGGNANDQDGAPIPLTFAPAATTDPGGEYVMVLYANGSDGQIYSTYLERDAVNQAWSPPQAVGSQQTIGSPAVVATETGFAYLFYRRTDQDHAHTNLSISGPLPLLRYFGSNPS